MKPCPKCGTQTDGAFCPNCGSQVAAQAPPPPPPQHAGYGHQAPAYQPPQPPYAPQPQQPGFPPQAPQPPYPPQMPQTPGYPQQGVYPQQQQYPGVQYGMQQPPKKGGSALKWVLGIVGGLVGLFVLLLVVAAFLPDPQTDPGSQVSPANRTAAMTEIVITDKVDENTQEPKGAKLTSTPYGIKQVFAVSAVNLKQGEKLSAQWFVDGQYVKDFDANIVADKDYTDTWASFNIHNSGKELPRGTYKVVWYIDGTAGRDASFTIK